jgi:uncharacterized phosphatase
MRPLPGPVLLIRHAETQWNRDQIGYGHTDIPLSVEGYEAAWNYQLPSHIHRIFTSPLSRAAETANVIAHRASLPTPTIVPALIERNHGLGEGVPKSIRPSTIPGRESDVAIRIRTLPFLHHMDNHTLIVTHAGVIRALTGHKPAHLETVPWHG